MLMDRPAWTCEARDLVAGQRLFRYGRWHHLTKVSPTPSGVIIETDEQVGENQFGPLYRTFISAPGTPVAAQG